jgi:cell division protein FtsB
MALPTRGTLPIICPFSGRLDYPTIPDHVLSTSEPKASRAKVHLAAPDRLIWLVVGAIVLWGVWAFGSELMLNLRLNHEVQSLRDGNAQLAASNDQARREVSVAASPAAMEEAARKSGFARPGEQVYVIVKPSDSAAAAAVGESAAPSVVPSAAVRKATAKQVGGIGVIDAVEKWWRSLWH